MENIRRILRRIRLVCCKTTPKTKVIVIAAIVLCMVSLLAVRGRILQTQAEAAALEAEVQRLHQENAHLEQKIGNLGTAEGIRKIAEEELGLVDPDTIIYETAE